MPASLPGATLAQNLANPSQGPAVLFDAVSGPKGSPFDKDNEGNASTGGLCTGIGFGSPPIFEGAAPFADANFSDDYVLGITLPSGLPDNFSTLVYIGGGKSNADGTPDMFPASETAICMAGNGGSRDGGAGPAFVGFPIKTVTATGAVANGAAVETGFINRSGVALVSGQSVFGSDVDPNDAIS